MIRHRFDFNGISIRSNASNIIICDTQSEDIDLVRFHNYCIETGNMHGIPYHYVILKNGDVHNTKPINYKSELYPQINDDVVIALEGNTNNADITAIQKSELITLVNQILEKECLPFFAVATLADLVGGLNPGQKTNWADIKETIKNNWTSVSSSRIPLANMYSQGDDGTFQKDIAFYVIKKGDNAKRVAKSLGADISNIKTPSDINGTMAATSSGASYVPGTPIIFKNNPIYQANSIALHQSKISSLIKSVATQKISTFNKTLAKSVQNTVKSSTSVTSSRTTKSLAIKDTIPQWQNEEIKIPGYSRAKLVFTNIYTGATMTLPFLVSPSSFTDNRTTQQQMTKTTSGWFVMRMGQQMTSLNLTGYMLDTESIKERQAWIVAYNTYIKDTKDTYFQYENKYMSSITIEGRTYTGFVQNIGLSKSAVQQFLYQYNISFVSLSETSAYTDMRTLLPSSTEASNRTLTANFSVETKKVANSLYFTLLQS